jgi:spore coat polysaccharide biosynthesis protein SpsF
VLKKVAGKSLLEHQIERLRRTRMSDEIVIATTTNEADLPIVELCEKLNVCYHRGSEENVLSRYYETAIKYKADVIVRVTSDCPVIDPMVIDSVINLFLEKYPDLDYLSNTRERTFPRGMDTEVFSMQTLEETFQEATEKLDLEHVTHFIRRQNDRYNVEGLTYHENQSSHRWTVDTQEDLDLVSKIINALYTVKTDFTLEDILKLLEENPEWVKINAHVETQKYGV